MEQTFFTHGSWSAPLFGAIESEPLITTESLRAMLRFHAARAIFHNIFSIPKSLDKTRKSEDVGTPDFRTR